MKLWTEGDKSINSLSLDSLRKLFSMDDENAHDALQDVIDTANIFIMLQKARRKVYQNMKFEKAFANGKTYLKGNVK